MQTRVGADVEAAQRPLDLEKGIDDPRGPRDCTRWPEGRFLVSESSGLVVLGCCRATNLCDCARHRYIRETTRVLVLDSETDAPTIFAVLTARSFLQKDDELRRTFAQLLKALRRRWRACEWFVRWEDQARGALHANLLVKGVPAEDVDAFRELLVAVWCSRVDALPRGQYVEAIESGRGVTSYVAMKMQHAGKTNQEPELARFKHRTSQTRGYFKRPMPELRAEAQRSLQYEALIWRGMTSDEALDELGRREAERWLYVRRQPGTDPPGAGGGACSVRESTPASCADEHRAGSRAQRDAPAREGASAPRGPAPRAHVHAAASPAHRQASTSRAQRGTDRDEGEYRRSRFPRVDQAEELEHGSGAGAH